MSSLPGRPRINYESDDEMDWIHYLDQNMSTHSTKDSPFPESNWNYVKHESVFDQEDGLKKTDEHVKARVTEALYTSDKVDASNVFVDVLNGHVLLTGEMKSKEMIAEATRIIEKIEGVWGVENELNVFSDTRAKASRDIWQMY